MDLLSVRLRPFTEPDLELFDRFATDPAFSEPFEWVGFTPPGGFRKRWEQDGLLGSSPYCLAVVTVDDDVLAGWVDWRQTERPGSGAWAIGAFRIWAATEVENIAEQRALDRSGFGQEGRLRGTHFRDGQWRDSFIYGITRDDITLTGGNVLDGQRA
jgi:hypothetical protein